MAFEEHPESVEPTPEQQFDEAMEKPESETQPEIKGCEYHIGFLFQCPHCQHQQAVVDPKLVVVGLQGATVRFKCQRCEGACVTQPANRIVGAQVGVQPQLNRHQRRAQRVVGLVGPDGRAVR